MNKLLKVLEDRKVYLESAYYNSEDTHIPAISTIFFRMDCRLISALLVQRQDRLMNSTCSAFTLHGSLFPPIDAGGDWANCRECCSENWFHPCPEAVDVVKRYATNGREAVNVIQLAAGFALTEKRETIQAADVEWVANSSQIPPRPDRKIPTQPQIGL